MEPQATKPYSNNYPDWHYQPLRLLKNEIANPMGVIAEFFSAYHLPEARKHLKEMLEDATCNVEVYAINYLTIYDNIEKLMEAAWLILQAEKEVKQQQVIISKLQDQVLVAMLQLLIATIHPERLFLLSWQEYTLVDLLIVVPDKSTRPFSHYETLIETAFYNIPEICFYLIQVNALKQHLEDGHLFYLSAARKKSRCTAAARLTCRSHPPQKEKN